ncbi:MAG TPA: SgcJ/EcaC family oxidoreductase [Burkholderiales bacterium]|nr:SgcJ/EcaC family oxidoreductase [Burkholderiales bacterium]
MTRLIAILWLVLLPAGAFAQDAADAVRQEVLAATAAWIEAFNTRDPQRIAALYAPDAVFWGTVSPTIRTTPREILEYFESSAVRRPTLRMSLGEQHVRVYGNVAINSGYYTSRYVEDGREILTPLRFTFAYRKSGGRWAIVNHHSSRMPAP